MPFDHDIWSAVPPTGGGPVDKSLLRGCITARMPYVLGDDENPGDLVCVDPETGRAIIDINYVGRIFHFDPFDGTTEPDGETCIVCQDGRRYKIRDVAEIVTYSVLDILDTPPDDPSLGDSYLVAAASTEDWVGKDNQVAIWTARGWVFVIFGIGRLLYVESVEGYYHRKSTGEWVSGFGNQSFEDASIPTKALIGGGGRVRWVVENQTTNTPPAISGTATWIIGPTPTGRWAGKAGSIAAIETGIETIYAPSNGWEAYDKAQNASYTFNGTAWASSAGAILDYFETPLSNSAMTSVGSNNYSYNSNTPPTTSALGYEDPSKLTFSARRTGQKFMFEYSLALGNNTSNLAQTVALFRDSEVNAIGWAMIVTNQSGLWGGMVRFPIEVSDTNSHTYKMRVVQSAGNTITFVDRRCLSARGAA